MARERPDAWGKATDASSSDDELDRDQHDRREDADDAQRVRDLWPVLMATWQSE